MKRYLIFAAISPFIGGFLLLLATTYQSGYWTETTAAEVTKLFVVFVKSLTFSYLFGIVPALMLAAIDDIVMHIRRIGPGLRVLIVGLVGFFAGAFIYGSRGAESGALQYVLYGLVGLVPTTLSSWLSHKYAEEPQPETSASR